MSAPAPARRTRLFVVCGLGVSASELASLFGAFGELRDVRVVADKGVAYVTFASAAHAEAAIERVTLEREGARDPGGVATCRKFLGGCERVLRVMLASDADPSPTKTDPETDRDPPSRPARRPRAASPGRARTRVPAGPARRRAPGGAIRPRATARGGEGKGNAREEKPGPPRREERGASAGVSRRRPGRRPAQIATLRRVPEGGLPGPTQGRLPGPYTRRGRGEGEGDGRGRRGGREPLGEQPLGDRRRLGDDGRTRRRRRYGRSRRRRR